MTMEMLSSCSPHRETCGITQIHSPGHIIQYDPHSAIREIRRSLSRSPSKTADLRPFSYRSSPAKNSIPFCPSPLSPSRRSTSDNILHLASFSSPQQSRFGQPSRIHRPALRRSVQNQIVTRTRTSPKSPTKRTLSDLTDGGNSSPMLRKRSSTEFEADLHLDNHISTENKENNTHQYEDAMIWKSVQTRQDKRRSGGFLNDVPLSPRKRTDSSMNLDQPDFGSPSAKRRSVHTTSGLDFSIFDSEAMQTGVEQKRSQDDNDWCRPSSPFSASRFSTIPKRSSSLRKSTLQQRQPERFNQIRLNQLSDDGSSWADETPGSGTKKCTRMSLDNHLQPMQRESPFSSQGSLLNASIHPVTSSQHSQTLPQRHPLSRTMTQSSSTSSVQDDSPTHEPIRRPDRPKSLDFSKSLPVGALRPTESSSQEYSEFSSQGSFATPANYKTARPLPAAFMSTGLISKKNRNVEDPDGGLPKAHMPDTPCKKQSVIFEPSTKFRVSHTAATERQPFGTPATPAETGFGISRATVLPWGKSSSIFGLRSTKQSLARKASFASIDCEDKPTSQSPSGQGDSQSTDTEYPPTPTKHATLDLQKSTSISPSFQRSHDQRHSFPGSSQILRFSNITPYLEHAGRTSPQTPQEAIFPPDPSGLTISGRGNRPVTRPGSSHLPIPATPTGPREYFANFSHRPSLNLNASDIADVDRSLSSKFEKADLVGTGEFSQVYRVSQPPQTSPFSKGFGLASSRSSSSLPDRVWAVKKSRYPYTGPKDRQRKVHEVDVLKALGQGEHIVSFVDSWEDRGHLYIQTEFCEEGTLDVFLAQVGLKARLDDFRIWKILLELSLGLKHIHDNGYIHLDLKPANIFIAFDGTLKIGDFGMASKWPAKAGIEGEGDREYIGPEILMGQYDKPADIFALGLIMLETAANVELPDNGLSWQKLRQGDMSDVPSLTWSSDDSNIPRDHNGNPLAPEDQEVIDDMNNSTDDKVSHTVRSGELRHPPEFMINPTNSQALDSIVRWMISPNPADRPVIQQILEVRGVQFAESRRRAGGTVFEGNWGPADEIIAEDAEMIDV